MVHAWEDPALVPVETKRRGMVLLDDEGNATVCGQAPSGDLVGRESEESEEL